MVLLTSHPTSLPIAWSMVTLCYEYQELSDNLGTLEACRVMLNLGCNDNSGLVDVTMLRCTLLVYFMFTDHDI